MQMIRMIILQDVSRRQNQMGSIFLVSLLYEPEAGPKGYGYS